MNADNNLRRPPPVHPPAFDQLDAAAVNERLSFIREHMPQTYEAIRERARLIGNEAYRLVRQGVAGRPDCFFAIEGVHVAGTPFRTPGVAKDLAWGMATGLVSSAIVWPMPKEEAEGTHGKD